VRALSTRVVAGKIAVGNPAWFVAAENLCSVFWVHAGKGRRHHLCLEALDRQDFLA
jgi:hypothetical protein